MKLVREGNLSKFENFVRCNVINCIVFMYRNLKRNKLFGCKF